MRRRVKLNFREHSKRPGVSSETEQESQHNALDYRIEATA